MLTVSMATAVLSAYVTNMRIGDTGYAFLLDARGKVIAHQSMQDSNFRKDFGGHPAFVAFTKEGKSSLVYQDEERNAAVIAYMKRTDAGWTLVTQQDYDEAFSAIASANKNAVVTLVIALSMVLVAAYILSSRLTRPIRRLIGIANEASLANFSAVDGNMAEKDRSDEIGELARSLERLAVSLRVAMGRLQKKP
jgi:methyl-accepting chemotaxis protein